MRDISLAKDHALAVDAEGRVWSWGKNATGQLGRPGPATFAEVVPGLERIVAVQAGGSINPGGGYCVALDDDGVIWTWGDGNFGVLGALRPSATHSTPTAILGVPRFVSVAAGFYHVVAIDSEGSLWVWGHNYGRHIGTGSPRAANEKEELNSRISSPLRLELGARFTCVSASKQDLTEPPFVCQWTTALDEHGRLWTWGYGSHGTLATGKRKSVPEPGPRTISTPPLVEVAAGAAHAMALDREGGFWVWGGAEHFNNRGSLLGTGESKGSLFPVHLPLVN